MAMKRLCWRLALLVLISSFACVMIYFDAAVVRRRDGQQEFIVSSEGLGNGGEARADTFPGDPGAAAWAQRAAVFA